jgi:hypothetical protein
MDLNEVTDQRTLGRYVEMLLPRANRQALTLEAYLCALLDGVLRARDEVPSHRLFAALLERALDADVPAQETAALERLASDIEYETASEHERVVRQLAVQIIDLREMRAAGILDLSAADLWWGQDSPRGHRWYNYTVWAYLEPTARHADDADDLDEDGVSWVDLAFVIGDGQCYE